MTSRQRGAAWLVAALALGRVLDGLDLPFERREPITLRSPRDSLGAQAAPTPSLHATAVSRPDSAPAPPRTGRPRLVTPVRVNQANAAELQRLPGVGPVLAGRILARRASHGSFHGLEDLRAVRGIGPRTCERLASLVRFD